MPVSPSKGGGRARSSPGTPAASKAPPSWESLEASKMRLAQTMDKVEFLASTRNRFTDLASKQATDLELTMRHRGAGGFVGSATRGHVTKHLSRSVPSLDTMITEHQGTMSGNKTPLRRLEALNKYVIDAELKANGEQSANAAKKSAKKLAPLEPDYPAYKSLVTTKLHPRGMPREPPLMAVECSFPYRPPEDVLLHGCSGNIPFHLSQTSFASSLSKSRRGKSKSSDVDAESEHGSV